MFCFLLCLVLKPGHSLVLLKSLPEKACEEYTRYFSLGPVCSPKAGMPCFASAGGETVTCNLYIHLVMYIVI